jgi:hypothetical protein
VSRGPKHAKRDALASRRARDPQREARHAWCGERYVLATRGATTCAGARSTPSAMRWQADAPEVDGVVRSAKHDMRGAASAMCWQPEPGPNHDGAPSKWTRPGAMT